MKIQMLVLIGATLSLNMAQAEDADVVSAQTIYAESCATCHGPAGRGMASFPSIAGKDAAHISTRLMQYRAGERVGPNSLLMIPMAADLSDDEIADLAAYISTAFE